MSEARRPRPDTTPTLRIGELARRSGRSVHTIRWYEAQHLMPGAARDAAGRRLFSEAHVEWLGLIARLRGSGMSVSDLRAYARLVRQGKGSLAACRELLRQHAERVAAQQEELRAAQALIAHKIALYDVWLARAG